MEEYLANMRTLRSYMNDLEEEAAKRSAEEQRQRTAIDAHDSDIALVRAQAKQVSDEAEHLAKARAHVCVEMAEKQGRIASLEVVGATLKQAEAPMNKQNIFEGKRYEVLNLGGSIDKESDVGKKLLDIKAKGSQLLLEISECKQTLEQESNITASFPAAVQEMDKKSLEEEYKALQGDGAGEAEYFQSLEERIIKMKGVSDPIKCCCGLEYNVELGGESMGVR
ncbi:uncharacterized protein [Aegilops tauschii subsp. strangulata]|uniref:uncharacterized protein isoform X2 n=1 Tax=Aegilops tauschii subsp. strangulata TaxID=200361 RepID=UPI001E1CAF1A|nr:uncharacterized protein LOC109740658 isoform X2 [Aegilops tauschii subsp. strangulata]